MTMFSVRIVTVNHYNGAPIPGLDVEFSEFRNSKVSQVPVLRIFGSTPAGQKTCLHVHGVFPYFYVPCEEREVSDKFLQQLALSVDVALQVSTGNAGKYAQHVFKITPVSGRQLYGYRSTERQFLKIYFYNPFVIKRAADLLLSGAVLNRVFQPFEAHVPFNLQFFIDYNLYGMNLLNLATVKFRKRQGGDGDALGGNPGMGPGPADESLMFNSVSTQHWAPADIPESQWLPEDVKRQSVCELEVDGVATDILNRLDLKDNVDTNPGLVAIWEDERQRREQLDQLSEMVPPSSPERGDILPQESEQDWLERLQEVVNEQLRDIQGTISTPENRPGGLGEEDQQGEVMSPPASQSTNQPEDHLSQQPASQPREVEVEPVINEELVLSQITASQAADKELADLLMDMGEDDDSILSPATQGDVKVGEEDPAVTEQRESLEMSQVWEGGGDDEEGVDSAPQRDEMLIPELDETSALAEDSDSEMFPLPQLDGQNDPMPQKRRKKSKLQMVQELGAVRASGQKKSDLTAAAPLSHNNSRHSTDYHGVQSMQRHVPRTGNAKNLPGVQTDFPTVKQLLSRPRQTVPVHHSHKNDLFHDVVGPQPRSNSSSNTHPPKILHKGSAMAIPEDSHTHRPSALGSRTGDKLSKRRQGPKLRTLKGQKTLGGARILSPTGKSSRNNWGAYNEGDVTIIDRSSASDSDQQASREGARSNGPPKVSGKLSGDLHQLPSSKVVSNKETSDTIVAGEKRGTNLTKALSKPMAARKKHPKVKRLEFSGPMNSMVAKVAKQQHVKDSQVTCISGASGFGTRLLAVGDHFSLGSSNGRPRSKVKQSFEAALSSSDNWSKPPVNGGVETEQTSCTRAKQKTGNGSTAQMKTHQPTKSQSASKYSGSDHGSGERVAGKRLENGGPNSTGGHEHRRVHADKVSTLESIVHDEERQREESHLDVRKVKPLILRKKVKPLTIVKKKKKTSLKMVRCKNQAEEESPSGPQIVGSASSSDESPISAKKKRAGPFKKPLLVSANSGTRVGSSHDDSTAEESVNSDALFSDSLEEENVHAGEGTVAGNVTGQSPKFSKVGKQHNIPKSHSKEEPAISNDVSRDKDKRMRPTGDAIGKGGVGSPPKTVLPYPDKSFSSNVSPVFDRGRISTGKRGRPWKGGKGSLSRPPLVLTMNSQTFPPPSNPVDEDDPKTVEMNVIGNAANTEQETWCAEKYHTSPALRRMDVRLKKLGWDEMRRLSGRVECLTVPSGSVDGHLKKTGKRRQSQEAPNLGLTQGKSDAVFGRVERSSDGSEADRDGSVPNIDRNLCLGDSESVEEVHHIDMGIIANVTIVDASVCEGEKQVNDGSLDNGKAMTSPGVALGETVDGNKIEITGDGTGHDMDVTSVDSQNKNDKRSEMGGIAVAGKDYILSQIAEHLDQCLDESADLSLLGDDIGEASQAVQTLQGSLIEIPSIVGENNEEATMDRELESSENNSGCKAVTDEVVSEEKEGKKVEEGPFQAAQTLQGPLLEIPSCVEDNGGGVMIVGSLESSEGNAESKAARTGAVTNEDGLEDEACAVDAAGNGNTLGEGGDIAKKSGDGAENLNQQTDGNIAESVGVGSTSVVSDNANGNVGEREKTGDGVFMGKVTRREKDVNREHEVEAEEAGKRGEHGGAHLTAVDKNSADPGRGANEKKVADVRTTTGQGNTVESCGQSGTRIQTPQEVACGVKLNEGMKDIQEVPGKGEQCLRGQRAGKDVTETPELSQNVRGFDQAEQHSENRDRDTALQVRAGNQQLEKTSDRNGKCSVVRTTQGSQGVGSSSRPVADSPEDYYGNRGEAKTAGSLYTIPEEHAGNESASNAANGRECGGFGESGQSLSGNCPGISCGDKSDPGHKEEEAENLTENCELPDGTVGDEGVGTRPDGNRVVDYIDGTADNSGELETPQRLEKGTKGLGEISDVVESDDQTLEIGASSKENTVRDMTDVVVRTAGSPDVTVIPQSPDEGMTGPKTDLGGTVENDENDGVQNTPKESKVEKIKGAVGNSEVLEIPQSPEEDAASSTQLADVIEMIPQSPEEETVSLNKLSDGTTCLDRVNSTDKGMEQIGEAPHVTAGRTKVSSEENVGNARDTTKGSEVAGCLPKHSNTTVSDDGSKTAPGEIEAKENADNVLTMGQRVVEDGPQSPGWGMIGGRGICTDTVPPGVSYEDKAGETPDVRVAGRPSMMGPGTGGLKSMPEPASPSQGFLKIGKTQHRNEVEKNIVISEETARKSGMSEAPKRSDDEAMRITGKLPVPVDGKTDNIGDEETCNTEDTEETKETSGDSVLFSPESPDEEVKSAECETVLEVFERQQHEVGPPAREKAIGLSRASGGSEGIEDKVFGSEPLLDQSEAKLTTNKQEELRGIWESGCDSESAAGSRDAAVPDSGSLETKLQGGTRGTGSSMSTEQMGAGEIKINGETIPKGVGSSQKVMASIEERGNPDSKGNPAHICSTQGSTDGIIKKPVVGDRNSSTPLNDVGPPDQGRLLVERAKGMSSDESDNLVIDETTDSLGEDGGMKVGAQKSVDFFDPSKNVGKCTTISTNDETKQVPSGESPVKASGTWSSSGCPDNDSLVAVGKSHKKKKKKKKKKRDEKSQSVASSMSNIEGLKTADKHRAHKKKREHQKDKKSKSEPCLLLEIPSTPHPGSQEAEHSNFESKENKTLGDVDSPQVTRGSELKAHNIQSALVQSPPGLDAPKGCLMPGSGNIDELVLKEGHPIDLAKFPVEKLMTMVELNPRIVLYRFKRASANSQERSTPLKDGLLARKGTSGSGESKVVEMNVPKPMESYSQERNTQPEDKSPAREKAPILIRSKAVEMEARGVKRSESQEQVFPQENLQNGSEPPHNGRNIEMNGKMMDANSPVQSALLGDKPPAGEEPSDHGMSKVDETGATGMKDANLRRVCTSLKDGPRAERAPSIRGSNESFELAREVRNMSSASPSPDVSIASSEGGSANGDAVRTKRHTSSRRRRVHDYAMLAGVHQNYRRSKANSTKAASKEVGTQNDADIELCSISSQDRIEDSSESGSIFSGDENRESDGRDLDRGRKLTSGSLKRKEQVGVSTTNSPSVKPELVFLVTPPKILKDGGEHGNAQGKQQGKRKRGRPTELIYCDEDKYDRQNVAQPSNKEEGTGSKSVKTSADSTQHTNIQGEQTGKRGRGRPKKHPDHKLQKGCLQDVEEPSGEEQGARSKSVKTVEDGDQPLRVSDGKTGKRGHGTPRKHTADKRGEMNPSKMIELAASHTEPVSPGRAVVTTTSNDASKEGPAGVLGLPHAKSEEDNLEMDSASETPLALSKNGNSVKNIPISGNLTQNKKCILPGLGDDELLSLQTSQASDMDALWNLSYISPVRQVPRSSPPQIWSPSKDAQPMEDVTAIELDKRVTQPYRDSGCKSKGVLLPSVCQEMSISDGTDKRDGEREGNTMKEVEEIGCSVRDLFKELGTGVLKSSDKPDYNTDRIHMEAKPSIGEHGKVDVRNETGVSSKKKDQMLPGDVSGNLGTKRDENSNHRLDTDRNATDNNGSDGPPAQQGAGSEAIGEASDDKRTIQEIQEDPPSGLPHSCGASKGSVVLIGSDDDLQRTVNEEPWDSLIPSLPGGSPELLSGSDEDGSQSPKLSDVISQENIVYAGMEREKRGDQSPSLECVELAGEVKEKKNQGGRNDGLGKEEEGGTERGPVTVVSQSGLPGGDADRQANVESVEKSENYAKTSDKKGREEQDVESADSKAEDSKEDRQERTVSPILDYQGTLSQITGLQTSSFMVNSPGECERAAASISDLGDHFGRSTPECGDITGEVASSEGGLTDNRLPMEGGTVGDRLVDTAPQGSGWDRNSPVFNTVGNQENSEAVESLKELSLPLMGDLPVEITGVIDGADGAEDIYAQIEVSLAASLTEQGVVYPCVTPTRDVETREVNSKRRQALDFDMIEHSQFHLSDSSEREVIDHHEMVGIEADSQITLLDSTASEGDSTEEMVGAKRESSMGEKEVGGTKRKKKQKKESSKRRKKEKAEKERSPRKRKREESSESPEQAGGDKQKLPPIRMVFRKVRKSTDLASGGEEAGTDTSPEKEDLRKLQELQKAALAEENGDRSSKSEASSGTKTPESSSKEHISNPDVPSKSKKGRKSKALPESDAFVDPGIKSAGKLRSPKKKKANRSKASGRKGLVSGAEQGKRIAENVTAPMSITSSSLTPGNGATIDLNNLPMMNNIPAWMPHPGASVVRPHCGSQQVQQPSPGVKELLSRPSQRLPFLESPLGPSQREMLIQKRLEHSATLVRLAQKVRARGTPPPVTMYAGGAPPHGAVPSVPQGRVQLHHPYPGAAGDSHQGQIQPRFPDTFHGNLTNAIGNFPTFPEYVQDVFSGRMPFPAIPQQALLQQSNPRTLGRGLSSQPGMVPHHGLQRLQAPTNTPRDARSARVGESSHPMVVPGSVKGLAHQLRPFPPGSDEAGGDSGMDAVIDLTTTKGQTGSEVTSPSRRKRLNTMENEVIEALMNLSDSTRNREAQKKRFAQSSMPRAQAVHGNQPVNSGPKFGGRDETDTEPGGRGGSRVAASRGEGGPEGGLQGTHPLMSRAHRMPGNQSANSGPKSGGRDESDADIQGGRDVSWIAASREKEDQVGDTQENLPSSPGTRAVPENPSVYSGPKSAGRDETVTDLQSGRIDPQIAAVPLASASSVAQGETCSTLVKEPGMGPNVHLSEMGQTVEKPVLGHSIPVPSTLVPSPNLAGGASVSQLECQDIKGQDGMGCAVQAKPNRLSVEDKKPELLEVVHGFGTGTSEGPPVRPNVGRNMGPVQGGKNTTGAVPNADAIKQEGEVNHPKGGKEQREEEYQNESTDALKEFHGATGKEAWVEEQDCDMDQYKKRMEGGTKMSTSDRIYGGERYLPRLVPSQSGNPGLKRQVPMDSGRGTTQADSPSGNINRHREGGQSHREDHNLEPEFWRRGSGIAKSSVRKNVFVPVMPPPTRAEIQASLGTYGLTEFVHRAPYWEKSKDVPAFTREAANMQVLLNLDLPAGLKEACSPMSSSGLNHWRTLMFVSDQPEAIISQDGPFHSEEGRVVMRALLESAASKREVVLTPSKLPPTRHEVMKWLQRQSKAKLIERDDGRNRIHPQKVYAKGQSESDCVALKTEDKMDNDFEMGARRQSIPESGHGKDTSMDVGDEAPPSPFLPDMIDRMEPDTPPTFSPTSPLSGDTHEAPPSHITPLVLHSTPVVQGRKPRPLQPAGLTPILVTSGRKTGGKIKRRVSLVDVPGSGVSKALTPGQASMATPLARKGSFLSQLEGASLKNTCGFKCSQSNLQDAKALHENQNLTLMSLELHIHTRGKLRPDPEFDPIRAVFFCIASENYGEGVGDGSSTEHAGAIIVSNPNKNQIHDAAETSSKPPLSTYGLPDVKVTNVENESAMFQEVVRLIREHDPDFLIGYEIQQFSWGYLLDRATALDVKMCANISRLPDNEKESHFSSEKDAYGASHTSEVNIAGRIVLNIWRLLRHEIALNIYTFENVAYHVLHQRVPLFSLQDLSAWFDHQTHLLRWRVVEHYMYRVLGNLKILKQMDLIGRTSELARVFGIEFFSVLSRGTQFRVESMMLRQAKAQNHVAISPSVQQRAMMKAPECIALVMEPESRLYEDPVIVLDFQSLYPSMMIGYNYCFSTCLGRVEHIARGGHFVLGCTTHYISPSQIKRLLESGSLHVSPNGVVFVKKNVRHGILPRMLEQILNTRIMVKKGLKDHKGDKVLQRMLDNRQLGLKLIANVTYGYTSASFSGRMPCIEVGDSIVMKARETLERAIHLVETTSKWGAKVVYGDTDSMFVMVKGASKERAFEVGREIVAAVSKVNPKPVKLKLEKVYKPCVLQAKKRYVGFMYETPDQKEPELDAKGIETIRRDSCPAVSKILEKALKIVFTTQNVSQVKRYVQKQFQKIIDGRINLQDLVFAKEYRGRQTYKPGACVPALELTKRSLAVDKRSEPRVGERVPYVIVNGVPGLPLIQLVRRPDELTSDPALIVNSAYYITRQIVPALNRVFGIMGVETLQWYEELPRNVRAQATASNQPNRTKKGTISQYFSSLNCLICDQLTKTGLCGDCRKQPQLVMAVLGRRIQDHQRAWLHLTKICRSCTGFPEPEPSCMSNDCPIQHQLTRTQRKMNSVPQLIELLQEMSPE